MDFVQGIVGGVVQGASSVSEARDRKKYLKHQKSLNVEETENLKEIRKDVLSMDRDKHSLTMETERFRMEKEKIELQKAALELQKIQEKKDKEEDIDDLIFKAVDEPNVPKLSKLVKSPYSIDLATLDIAEEIAQVKNNPVVLKLLSLARKKIEARKMMPDRDNLFAFFQEVDVDNSGAIDAVELQSALTNGSWTPFKLETIHAMIRMYTKEGMDTSTLEFDEFTSLWKKLTEVQQCFLLFDTDNSGRLGKAEFKSALSAAIGFSFSGEDCEGILKRFDKSGMGAISLDAFICCNIVLLETKTGYNSQAKCHHKFSEGETKYTCEDCTMDDENSGIRTILCEECFINSRHTKHGYKAYVSRTSGGYCDCGDTESWKKFPLCAIHKTSSSDYSDEDTSDESESESDEEESDEADAGDKGVECRRQFQVGEWYMSCLQCRKDNSIVLCGSCFVNSVHVNHETEVRQSSGNGFCDCGISDVWKSGSTCARHLRQDQSPRQVFDATLQLASECQEIFKEGERCYTCLDCRTNAGAILCGACFLNSSHTEHRYAVHVVRGDGSFCDCGDENVWKMEDTCELHK